MSRRNRIEDAGMAIALGVGLFAFIAYGWGLF
jgi:hypothetical protein